MNQQFFQQNMQYQQPMMQLPVSPYDYRGSDFVQGLPNNPTTYPNVQLSQNMTPYLRLICGHLMLEIQSKVTKNNLRIFCYNIYSANNWNNQMFSELVALTAQFSEMLQSSGQGGYNIEATIQTSAVRCVNYQNAKIITSFAAQGLQQFISPEQMQTLQSTLMEFQNVLQTLNNFSRQQQSSNYNYSANGYNQPMVNNNMAYPTNMNPAMMASQPSMSSGASNGMFNAMPGPVNHSPTMPLPQMGASLLSNNILREELIPVEEIVFTPNGESVGDLGVDFHEASSDNAPLRVYNGMTLVRESPSVKRSWSMSKPHAIAYNPRTHALFFHINKQGEAEEVLMPLGEVGMEYIDHELDLTFALKELGKQSTLSTRTSAQWDMLSNVTQVKDTVKEDGSLELPYDVTVFMNDRFIADSLQRAICTAKSMIVDTYGDEASSHSSIAFSYRKAIPFFISASDRNVINQFIDAFKETFDYFNVYAGLKICRNIMREDIWNYINNKLTNTVNVEMGAGLGLSTAIGSFHDDYVDLPAFLDKKNGELKKYLFKEQKDVIRDVLKILSGDKLKEYVGTITDKQYETLVEVEDRYLVFIDETLVVLVPWLGSKIDLKINGKYGSIMESSDPALFKAIETIMEKAKLMQIRRVQLITVDGVIVNVHRSLFSDDVYILSR
jgi:hypothetical protein